MGYTNITIFQGGMPEWSGKGLPVQKGNKPGALPKSQRSQQRRINGQ
jgi:3-mercaptopyruvate sulfurtransferase SseA